MSTSLLSTIRFNPKAQGSGIGVTLPRTRRAGMTLVEVMIALVVLTVAVFLLSTTVTATIAYSSDNRETALASNALQDMMEQLRGEEFTTVFAKYNHDTSDDRDGVGTAPGAFFSVRGVTPLSGVDEHHLGEITFPCPGPGLYENGVDDELGLPRDLNGDMQIDAADHSLDHLVLPVKVTVRWRGRTGPRSMELITMLANIKRL